MALELGARIKSAKALISTAVDTSRSLLRDGVELVHAPTATSNIHSVGEISVSARDEALGILNDASRLNRTTPIKIFKPATVSDVESAAEWARSNHIPITMGGSRHSMGRQQLLDDAVHIDMRGLDRMAYDATRGTILVQPGATWAEIQRFLDPLGRAPQVMQSSNVFTVGGSIASNIHGRDIRFGPIADSIESLAILKADGTKVVADRTHNADLFTATIGGFGLTGTVLEAELKTVPNELYKRTTHNMPLAEFGTWFTGHSADSSSRLMQARINPISMRDMHIVTFDAVPHEGSLPALRQKDPGLLEKIEVLPFQASIYNKQAKRGYWWIYRHLDNGLFAGTKPVTRNQSMSQSIEFLASHSNKHTQVVQEYFVPHDKLESFVDGLRAATNKHDVNMLNITVRNVQPDATALLSPAEKQRFAVVLFFDQHFTPESQATIDAFTSEVTDAAIDTGGSFYMTYRLPQTSDQARAAYPKLETFFDAQKRFDPDGLYDNGFKRWHDAFPA